MNGRTAVILAQPDDIHAQAVAWEIKQLGSRAIILDVADFPTQWRLGVSARSAADFFVITPDGERLEGENISGLWWRRIGTPKIPASVAKAEHRDFCRAESRALLEGWAYSLGQRVINPLAAELPARRKPFQLAMASRMNLPIPDTIITNDPAAVAEFTAAQSNGAIYKVLTGTSFQFTETRPVGKAELGTLDLLRFAPSIFQQRIDGAPDIRVTILDDRVFAAEITPNHPEAKIDWRLDMAAEAKPHDLPADTERRLRAYQHAMGLRYGAYDLRRDASGTYVFFEVNPAGQFLFIEIQAGFAISRAMAEALLAGDRDMAITSMASPTECGP